MNTNSSLGESWIGVRRLKSEKRSGSISNRREIREGYLSFEYARALAEFGVPIELPGCGGWILAQEIPGTGLRDARGLYPLLSCRDASELWNDLNAIGTEKKLVTFRAVLDPLTIPDVKELERHPWDVFQRFKKHYVVELQNDPTSQISSHHRRYARKALNRVAVSRSQDPTEEIDRWTALYDVLKARHDIEGIARFSRSSFSKQLSTPGIDVFRATLDDEVVGMILWYRQEDDVYYHLGAFSERGYSERASMALFWQSIEIFADEGFRLMNLGGGAGLSVDEEDGLARFKRGWSTDSMDAFLVGRVLDDERYAELISESGGAGGKFFPAYRAAG